MHPVPVKRSWALGSFSKLQHHQGRERAKKGYCYSTDQHLPLSVKELFYRICCTFLHHTFKIKAGLNLLTLLKQTMINMIKRKTVSKRIAQQNQGKHASSYYVQPFFIQCSVVWSFRDLPNIPATALFCHFLQLCYFWTLSGSFKLWLVKHEHIFWI